MSLLTCLTCQVGFNDNDLHRLHFKGDWHRYNLKRKVANLSIVGAPEFEARKVAHEAQAKIASGEVKESGNHCIACRKNFNTEKSYANHILSKKHKEMLLKVSPKDLENVKQKVKAKEEETKEAEEDEEEMEVEEVDSDEWDDEDPVPAMDCLFCSHHSANIDNNMRHMIEAHSFFLPDPEFLTDLDGLIEYLGAKVGQGHMCLWCSERSKSFTSLGSVQKHMLDKGHCKLKHEGETLLEYSDYYDYSTSYPDGENSESVDTNQEEVDLNSLDSTGLELQLPSGATIGHRSLVRYYRQSLNPNRELVAAGQARQRSAAGKLLSTYRAMGWTGSNRLEITKKVRDIKFMNKMRNKQYMQLGNKANKLQTYFKDRNGMCM